MLMYVFLHVLSTRFTSHANVNYIIYEHYLRHQKEAEELLNMGCSVMLLRLLPRGDQGGLPGPEGRQRMWEYCKHQNNLSDLPFIPQRPWKRKKATRGYQAGYIALLGIIQPLDLLLSIFNLTGVMMLSVLIRHKSKMHLWFSAATTSTTTANLITSTMPLWK